MGMLHAGIINRLDNLHLVAITEKEKMIRSCFQDLCKDIVIYDEVETMFRNESIDVAFITTPIASHYPIAQICIKNRVNFFIEKPLVKDLEETKKLVDVLKNYPQIIHAVGYNRRFIDTFAKAKSLLDANLLGEISSVKSSMYASNILSKPTGWRSSKKISGGGVLLDLGSHIVDLLLWYFGPIETIIAGTVKSVYSTEVEDFAHMYVKFFSGMEGEIDVSWSMPHYRLPELSIEVIGANGNLRVNEDFVTIHLNGSASQSPNSMTTIYKQALYRGVQIDLGGPEYTREDAHLVECILQSKQTLNNVYEAGRTQSVIQAMYDAASNNSMEKVEYLS
jgi:predicted dehydrogenase